jgi:hypothetical protein
MWSKMIVVDYYEVVCSFRRDGWLNSNGDYIMRAIAKIGGKLREGSNT